LILLPPLVAFVGSNGCDFAGVNSRLTVKCVHDACATQASTLEGCAASIAGCLSRLCAAPAIGSCVVLLRIHGFIHSLVAPIHLLVMTGTPVQLVRLAAMP
jgi:hypothetical protein